MLKLKIHNDGKEKHQSFEAWIGGIDVERGYGETQSEAIAAYLEIVERTAFKLQLVCGAIRTCDYEIVKAGCNGDEIK